MTQMYHPDVERVAEASEQAFLEVWRPRGWQRLEPAAYHASVALERVVTDPKDLTIDELTQLAAPRGGAEVSKGAKKADHVSAYLATFENEPAAIIDEDSDVLVTPGQVDPPLVTTVTPGADTAKTK
jgi:hypothetical protein